MIKKTIKWSWNIVCWPFTKLLKWLKSGLPVDKQ